ncbi:MAG: hypothetical protein R2688_00515 [Fimbriimonadaceae bacterium]
MIATLIAASTILGQEKSVKDFFPVIPNSVWRYEESQKGKSSKTVVEMKAGSPFHSGEEEVVPVTSTIYKATTTIYYKITSNEVVTMGYELDKFLDQPIPIIKLKDRGMSWKYVGETQLIGEMAPLTMDCSSRLIGKRKVLGEDREVLEVKYKAVIDAEIGNMKIESQQTAFYADGIGLYEMKENGKVGRSSTERTMKLISYVEGKE